MTKTILHLFFLLPLCASLVEPAVAQVPKQGDYYEDIAVHGFRVRMPKKWTFIPPSPRYRSLFGKFAPENVQEVMIGKAEKIRLQAWIVQFDRRDKAQVEVEVEIDEEGKRYKVKVERNYRDIHDWLRESGHVGGNGWRELTDEREDLRCSKDRDLSATQHVFSGFGSSADRPELRAYAAVYEISPEVEIALVFNGPGDDKKWRSYGKAFEKMAKTFQRMEVEELDLSGLGLDGSPRSQRKAVLLNEIRSQPGWKLHETENYLVISHNDDKSFIKELLQRAEAIRVQFETDYPPEGARRVPNTSEKTTISVRRPGDEDEPEGSEEDPLASVSVQADPFEEARASVIRVCRDREEYNGYGGPKGSAGYWSSKDRELVIYDAKKGSGRNATWAVLNHEAFHQYIYYFYGEASPHPWYNEGTGDFYSGYQWRYGRFQPKPFSWRTQVIAQMLRKHSFVPLEELVRYSKKEYYGTSEYGTNISQHYAQGWSFIWFLRTGQKHRKWDEAWDHILDTYLETFASTGDRDRAVDVAFAGVDWDELEEAWQAYIED